MTVLPDMVEFGEARRLGLRELDPGDLLDLIEAAGSVMAGEAASAWLDYAQMICSVSAIDGVPVPMPGTKDEIRALARRIGNDGLAALHPVFAEARAAEETMLDTAKN
ncbi:hypothetical protein [Swaminathania salitolerans]|uniref:Uncharacterized protein n=1 Tax=Swaminathania salitolerans TaxID=182838 RepID=A0A511BKJ9_9PROT|nr:hypothetical protein [Swaminathania salitolerans]GBQ09731.1 hypothetical protein AA21291_0176 [Swaminathania salitolerans LMG 21291]GEL00867.1 hypothetical protein SSA02_00300 [Swaminathania salitolerans]